MADYGERTEHIKFNVDADVTDIEEAIRRLGESSQVIPGPADFPVSAIAQNLPENLIMPADLQEYVQSMIGVGQTIQDAIANIKGDPGVAVQTAGQYWRQASIDPDYGISPMPTEVQWAVEGRFDEEMANEQRSADISAWQKLAMLQKTIDRARRGDEASQLGLFKKGYDIGDIDALSDKTEGELKAVKERLGIFPPSSEGGGGEDRESAEDRIAEKQAEAIMQAGMRYAGQAGGQLGIPGAGFMGPLGAMLGGGALMGGVAAGGMLIAGATAMRMEEEAKSLELDDLALRFGQMNLAERDTIMKDLPQSYLDGGMPMNATDALRNMWARRTVTGGDFESLANRQAAAIYAGEAGVSSGLANEMAYRRIGETVDPGSIALETRWARGLAMAAGTGADTDVIMKQVIALEQARMARTFDPISRMDQFQIRDSFGEMYLGDEYQKIHAAELIGMRSQMASAPGDDRKTAFMAQIFASEDDWGVMDGVNIGKDKSPQAFYAWMEAFGDDSSEREAILNLAKQRAPGQEFMELKQLGFAPSIHSAIKMFDTPTTSMQAAYGEAGAGGLDFSDYPSFEKRFYDAWKDTEQAMKDKSEISLLRPRAEASYYGRNSLGLDVSDLWGTDAYKTSLGGFGMIGQYFGGGSAPAPDVSNQSDVTVDVTNAKGTDIRVIVEDREKNSNNSRGRAW